MSGFLTSPAARARVRARARTRSGAAQNDDDDDDDDEEKKEVREITARDFKEKTKFARNGSP